MIWRRKLSNSLSDVSSVASWIAQIAEEQQLSADSVYALQVCTEELLSNIVQHGRSGDDSHEGLISIDLAVGVEPERVLVTIEDDGLAFDVAAAVPHTIDEPLDQIQPGGLGIHLVKTFANRVTYERAGLGNKVVLEITR